MVLRSEDLPTLGRPTMAINAEVVDSDIAHQPFSRLCRVQAGGVWVDRLFGGVYVAGRQRLAVTAAAYDEQ